ncbi:MAG: C10 family peptidase [Bacteroidaceae bacterium]|nr:C10 family peptidase [Bacteroidaceae bacterium]
MRKGLLLILCFVAVTIAMAGNVSPQQALEQARSFMQGREADGSRPRKAPGKGVLQMEMAGQESGLYLFNVSDGEGFVIVSNDDRTAPILGYSDSGSINPDLMPENMRWWLSEYAKQIAWMDENGITATTRAAAPRRAHSTTAIAPLLTTTWDQVWPYNLLCPEYSAGHNCATGCVATAMAQVMNYFEWPTAPTKDIASYTHSYFGTMGPLTNSVTFDWTNMLDSYNTDESESTDSDAEKTAVATLMKYCGYALKMGYWQSSGTSTSLVATALKEYFDYNATTTRYLSRSFYSDETWRDIIYYELSQNRPVVYGGSAVDNGHAFVCDGYKYESGTDLFHINWGWSGGSDGYFLLSVLNPAEQGTGGSPSASAYTFGQEAIIGIQPSTGSGDVLPAAKTPNEMDLTVNSISVSHPTIALGESVDITLNVKNNSSTAYDGDLYVITTTGTQLIGKTFQIPAGTTKDCVITYTPSEAKAYTLSYGFPMEAGGYGYPYPITITVGLTVENATPSALTTTGFTSQSATLNWTPAGTATKWNLRYRPVSMEKFNGSGLPTGWSTVKWDSDSYNWETSVGTGIGGSNCVASASYLGGVNLNQDNGLKTPLINLGGSISFSAWGEDETFIMYVSTDGINFNSISYIITTTSTPTRYSFDLGKYTGETGYVVIDHYATTTKSAESWLYVDDIAIVEPGTIWTKVNDITSRPYTLSGLTANTDYEAQVQAAFNDGGNWSEGVIFTTPYGLADNDLALGTKNTDVVSTLNGQTVDICLDGRTLYKDGDWNTLCLPFDITIAGSPLSGGEAKVFNATASEFSAGSRQLTLAFTDAPATITAGTPFVIKWASGSNLVSPVFSGVTISNASNNATSTDGKVTFTGLTSALNIASDDPGKLFLGNGNKVYAPMSGIKFGACRAYFQLNGITMNPSVGGSVKAFVLDFGDGKPTGIQYIDDLPQNDPFETWYTLDGRKMEGQPTQRGVYIKNGRKVVIK